MEDIPKSPATQGPGVALAPYRQVSSSRWRRYGTWALLGTLCLACIYWGFFFAVTVPFFLAPFVAPLGLLALLVIWALPDTERAPTKAVTVLFMGLFTSTMIWPNYLALTLPGMPWITTMRLFGFPLAFAILICTSVSKAFRAEVAEALSAKPMIWKLVTAFAVLQTLTILVSKHPVSSLNSTIADHTNWTLVFFAGTYVFLRKGTIERTAIILWAAALALCLFGIWENTIGHVPWSGHIPSFLAVQDEYVQRVLNGARRGGVGDYRVQTIQSTSLGLAEFLALATPFAIHFMVGRYHLALRIAAGLSIPLIFYVIMLTDARLGIVGFFLSVLLYVASWSIRRWRNVKGTLIGPAMTLAYPVLAVAFLALSFLWQRLRVMMWGGNETSGSSQARIDQYSMGIPKVLKHPWGYGPSMGGEELGYTNPAGDLTIDTYYLLIALDYGVIGFLLYYGALAYTIYVAGRHAYESPLPTREEELIVPIGIALAAFFVIKSIFSQAQNHALQFMLMAMVVVLVYRSSKGASESKELTITSTGARAR